MRIIFFALAILSLNGCAGVGWGVGSLATDIVAPSLNRGQDIRCHWEPSEDAPIVERRQVCEYAEAQP